LAAISRIDALSIISRASAAVWSAHSRRRAVKGGTRLHTRQCRGGCRTKSCPDEDRLSRRRAVSCVADVFQIPYSAVEREHEAAITAAAQKGAGIVIRGGAAKGAPTEGKQSGLQWERWRRAHLDDLLDGMTPMEFILRFTFTNADLDTTIVGTINPAHLQTNLDILQKGPLPPDLYEEAKHRLAAAGSAPQPRGE
jgi:aryl-alcohol dehydrogenase-like predicted oxidoreductase